MSLEANQAVVTAMERLTSVNCVIAYRWHDSVEGKVEIFRDDWEDGNPDYWPPRVGDVITIRTQQFARLIERA